MEVRSFNIHAGKRKHLEHSKLKESQVTARPELSLHSWENLGSELWTTDLPKVTHLYQIEVLKFRAVLCPQWRSEFLMSMVRIYLPKSVFFLPQVMKEDDLTSPNELNNI